MADAIISWRRAGSVREKTVFQPHGRADTEDRWLSTVLVDGKLRVYDSERIGPA